MRLNILTGGEAGRGINELATSISKILVKLGYYVFFYRDYQSIISGGHNFNVLCVSEKPISSFDTEIDILVALDEKTVRVHSKKLKNKGVVISENKGVKVQSDSLIEKNKLDIKVKNVIYASVLLQALGIDKKILIDELNEIFKGKPLLKQDLEAAEQGYKLKVESKFNLKKIGEKKHFMTGSNGVVQGAVNSSLQLYFAYPMTPAIAVLHELASLQDKTGIKVIQPENEIAAVNMALGSAFTGSLAMAGSSGGGFDLMTEAISMQGMSEIPLVIYLTQRAGPGTGVPTYTSQGDLNDAVYCGHGEFPRLVLAPGDAEEAIELTNKAFYFSQKYRILCIILSDKHLAESGYTFDKIPELRKIERQECKTDKNYELTESGISEMCIPGKNIAKASAYEHNEYGFTVEDAESVSKMQEKRKRKWNTLKKEVTQQETIKIYGNKNAKILLVGWGSTKGAILDFISENKNFKFMQVLYLEPFPSHDVKKEIEKSDKVLVIESNLTGQLADLIARNIGIIIPEKNRILKYDSRPFTPNELNKMLKGK